MAKVSGGSSAGGRHGRGRAGKRAVADARRMREAHALSSPAGYGELPVRDLAESFLALATAPSALTSLCSFAELLEAEG